MYLYIKRVIICAHSAPVAYVYNVHKALGHPLINIYVRVRHRAGGKTIG